MSMPSPLSSLLWVALLPLLLATLPLAAKTPQLGQPLTPEQVAAIDFTVLPDGRGLPPGEGNARQGLEVYQSHCSACHGPAGVGGINDQLAGGHGSLTTAKPVRTIGSYWPYATTVFDFIRRAMPYTAPGTLNNDELYALTAYLLHINQVVTEDAVMNAQTLPAVTMPNVGQFVWAVPKPE